MTIRNWRVAFVAALAIALAAPLAGVAQDYVGSADQERDCRDFAARAMKDVGEARANQCPMDGPIWEADETKVYQECLGYGPNTRKFISRERNKLLAKCLGDGRLNKARQSSSGVKSSAGQKAKAAPGAPRAIIVLDASGSMRGRIKGKQKMTIARETLSRVLGTLPPTMELGLMAYGHNRKGDCEDIETCDADPCALVHELEAGGVDFTTHVIGFGLSKKEGEQVACLADNTGGKYIGAKDAGALADALAQTVKAPEPEPEPVAQVPDPLHIRLFAGASRYKQSFVGDSGWDNVVLKLLRPGAAKNAKSLPFKAWQEIPGTKFRSTISEKLAAGDYILHVKFKTYQSDVPFTVTPGMANQLDLFHGAAILEPEFEAAPGGKKIPVSEPYIRFVPLKDGTPDRGRAIEQAWVILPPGKWLLETRMTRQERWRSVKIFKFKPGDIMRDPISLNFATVSVASLDASGKPIESPYRKICDPEPDGACDPVPDSFNQEFYVPAGRHRITTGNYYKADKWGSHTQHFEAGQHYELTIQDVR